MTRRTARWRARSDRPAPIASALIAGAAMTLSACAAPIGGASAPMIAAEEIYVLRSIRERQKPEGNWCTSSRTGFAPFPTDAERIFSFWSVQSRPNDGRIVDAAHQRVAALRGCFGPTNQRARQNFYAEVEYGALSFRGKGECRALATNFPEIGLFPVRCHLILSGLPAPYVGGLLTTNTMSSKAAFGGDTDPPGYTQASVATIRLWKARPSR